MEFIREDCIYARQSVDRKDSISIESQIDFCKYELKGGSCRIFKDKGYSGKNTDRPEFQKLLGEIRKGKVRRVIVYKLDRISRSILDFATMMELFQEYDVEFVSSTEKFDTSTPMGRAMLNICIVFAQLERETIQKRVTDAYYSRCLKGFHMSGQAPYGYQLEPTVVEGIRTKKMVADPVAADHVRLMFEMYAEPETSFGDITRYFEEQGIKIYEKSMVRSFLSQLLRNPVYAQADLELYEFFKSQGAAIVNDAFVIIGLLVAGPGTLPQAVVALGIEQPLLVKSCLLETMIHIGGQHKIVLSLHQFQKLLINWLRGVQIAIDIDIPAPIRPMFFQAVKGIEAA